MSKRAVSHGEGADHKKMKCAACAVNVLMVGTGEYTTGYVGGKSEADKSDKGAGVVALVMVDLRSKGKTDRLAMAGVNGKKFPAIRKHMKKNISDVYSGLDLTCETFPADDTVDSRAYIAALDTFSPGDACIIFTPDECAAPHVMYLHCTVWIKRCLMACL